MSANRITQEFVDEIYEKSEKVEHEVFGKTLITACKLPNGFVLVEDASCVDPANYDIEIGRQICAERIKNKIWELEGYVLQTTWFTKEG